MIVIENNKKVMEDDEKEKSRQFKEELQKFYSLHGKDNFKVPQIGGKELDLYKLFKEVMNRGGSHAVSESKQWKEIVNALELPASCTSASFTVRNHYNKCLLSYECYYVKLQNNPSLSMLNSMNSANLSRTNFLNSTTSQVNQGLSGQIPQSNQGGNQIIVNTIPISQPTPAQEQRLLGKKIVRPDPDMNVFFRTQSKPTTMNRDKIYQKKIRILNAIPDMRRVILAFESHLTNEIIWAINILSLFSSNQNCNLLIENQPYLMESITNYLYYCVNNISELCFIFDIMEGKYSHEHEKLKEKQHKGSNVISIMNMTYNNQVMNNNKNTLNLNLRRSKNTSNYKTNLNFLDDTNHTLNLSILMKRNQNLEETDKAKQEFVDDYTYEEVTEFELMEHLISLIQIIRNLSFIRANEASIIKCHKFMNLLYLLFIHSNIYDIITNTLDIINNLSKHIFLKDINCPIPIMITIFECLRSSNKDLSELALECLRRLIFPAGNEEYFEKMPDEFYQEMVNLLISYKVEVRDSALEILYCLADQKLPTKSRIGKVEKCIQRLVALVCSNSTDNRISKFAACTLAKLAEVPSILKSIMPYEQDLFVAACTDDSISKIILGIISN